MSDDTIDTDDTLRNRLRDRLSFNSADGDADEGTEQEGYSSDDHDEEDEDTEQEADTDTEQEADGDGDADEAEQEMDGGDAVDMLVANTEMDREEAMAFAEAIGATGGSDDSDGGATGDAEGELSAEAEADTDPAEVADAAAEAAAEVVDQELDARLDGVVTEDDLDAKLESFADAVGEETKNTIEQALTGETPTPDSSGGSEFSHDDLFSTDGSGDNGGE